MCDNVFPILLVDDDQKNVKLIQRLLSSTDCSILMRDYSFTLSVAANLSETLQSFEQEDFSAIILALNLAGNENLEALLTIRQKLPDIPIIIEIVEQNEAIIVRAFQIGANGYIRIKDLDANLLIYALRTAIERQQYVRELSQRQHQREFANLEILADYIQPPTITAKMFASSALKETIPELFAELTAKYAKLLDLSLEEKMFKVEYDISGELRNLAAKLGFLKASPRDVVDLHTKALKKKCANVNLAKVQAYVEEGRLRLLELMGYLTSYYRKYYIGLNNLNIAVSPDSDLN